MLRTTFRNLIGVLTFLLLGVLLTACDKNDFDLNASDLDEYDLTTRTPEGNANVCICVEDGFPVEALSAIEKEALIFMREEEKLARDVYIKMFEKWGTKPFENIKVAEQRHMDLMLCLIDKYELDDPVSNNAVGVFQNEDLKTAYNMMVNKGNANLGEAYIVGAMIEVLDIADLREYAEDADNEDILAVWSELERGSRNHLRAFDRNLENLGLAFTPESVNAQMYEEIVSSDHERGGKLCADLSICPNAGNQKGKGKNKGKGNRPCIGNQSGSGNGPGVGTNNNKGKGNRPCVGTGQGNPNRPCDGTGPGNKKGRGNKSGN